MLVQILGQICAENSRSRLRHRSGALAVGVDRAANEFERDDVGAVRRGGDRPSLLHVFKVLDEHRVALQRSCLRSRRC